MNKELKKAIERIAEIKASAVMQELAMLEKFVDKEKEPISKAIKICAKDNGTAITRFMHKPNNMVVNVRNGANAKGYINWDGQSWDWDLKLRTIKPQIQKVVTLSARF